MSFRSLSTMFLSVLGAALIASACSGSNGGIVVETKKGGFEFIPKSVTIKANTPTTITLKNPDAVKHDWVIREKSIEIDAEPGKQGSATVNLPAGKYRVICTEPGHEAAGMVGELVVS